MILEKLQTFSEKIMRQNKDVRCKERDRFNLKRSRSKSLAGSLWRGINRRSGRCVRFRSEIAGAAAQAIDDGQGLPPDQANVSTKFRHTGARDCLKAALPVPN